MNRGDHPRYLNALLTAPVELGRQRVAQAQWMLQQNDLSDRRQQAPAWKRSGHQITERARWALGSANHAIYGDTPGYENGCRLQDRTTIVIHRPVHRMRGARSHSWLYTLVTRPTEQPLEPSPDLWIPFTLSDQDDITRHARIIAPWIANAMV